MPVLASRTRVLGLGQRQRAIAVGLTSSLCSSGAKRPREARKLGAPAMPMVYLSEVSHLGLIQGALLSFGRGCLPRM
jgi:hypothetical protein